MKKKNIAIVTGASSGLGKEFVKLLSAKKGLDEIWIISRNEEKLKKIQKTIRRKDRCLSDGPLLSRKH